jgi:hypothetical protein
MPLTVNGFPLTVSAHDPLPPVTLTTLEPVRGPVTSVGVPGVPGSVGGGVVLPPPVEPPVVP